MASGRICISCMRELEETVNVCPKCGFDQRSYRPPAYVLPPYTILHGKYQIGRVLGEGGFGITYIARDLVLGHLVAVKEFFVRDAMGRNSSHSGYVVYSGLNPSQEMVMNVNRARFEEEAKILAELSELPNVVRVQDYFSENNTYYIVMEYLSGKTLREYVRENGGRIPLKDLQGKLEPILSALALVHGKNILHRDISPDNMKVIDSGLHKGMVKLFDFGGAIWADPHGQRIAGDGGVILKKDGYSPLEQIHGAANQGPWTDVYEMAATMYYCLCGRAPAPSQEREKNPNSFQTPSQLSAGLPSAVEKTLLKALEMDPKKRYASMEEFLEALREAGWDKEPRQVPPNGPGKPLWKKFVPGIAGVAVLLAAVAVLFGRNGKKAASELPVTRDGQTAYLSPRDGQEIRLKEGQDSMWLLFDSNITNPAVVTPNYSTGDLDVGEAETTASGDVRFPLYVKMRSAYWNRVKFLTADGTELTYVDVQTGGEGASKGESTSEAATQPPAETDKAPVTERETEAQTKRETESETEKRNDHISSFFLSSDEETETETKAEKETQTKAEKETETEPESEWNAQADPDHGSAISGGGFFDQKTERESEAIYVAPTPTPAPAPSYSYGGGGYSGGGYSGGGSSGGGTTGGGNSGGGNFSGAIGIEASDADGLAEVSFGDAAMGMSDTAHRNAVADPTNAVAKIGEDYYERLSLAVQDYEEGETIEIVQDLSLDSTMTSKKNLRIDFGSCAIRYSGRNYGFNFGGTVQITGGRFDGNVFFISKFGDVTIDGALVNGSIESRGILNLDGCVIVSKDTTALEVSDGSVTMSRTQVSGSGRSLPEEVESSDLFPVLSVEEGASLELKDDCSVSASGCAVDLVNTGTVIISRSTLENEQGMILLNGRDGTASLSEAVLKQEEPGARFCGIFNNGNARIEIASGDYPVEVRNMEGAHIKISGGTFGNEKDYGLINRGEAEVFGGTFDPDAQGRGIVNVGLGEVQLHAPLTSDLIRQEDTW